MSQDIWEGWLAHKSLTSDLEAKSDLGKKGQRQFYCRQLCLGAGFSFYFPVPELLPNFPIQAGEGGKWGDTASWSAILHRSEIRYRWAIPGVHYLRNSEKPQT